MPHGLGRELWPIMRANVLGKASLDKQFRQPIQHVIRA